MSERENEYKEKELRHLHQKIQTKKFNTEEISKKKYN